MENNPEAFRQLQEDQMRAASAQSASKPGDDAVEESKEPTGAADADGDQAEADAEAEAASQQ